MRSQSPAESDEGTVADCLDGCGRLRRSLHLKCKDAVRDDEEALRLAVLAEENLVGFESDLCGE